MAPLYRVRSQVGRSYTIMVLDSADFVTRPRSLRRPITKQVPLFTLAGPHIYQVVDTTKIPNRHPVRLASPNSHSAPHPPHHWKRWPHAFPAAWTPAVPLVRLISTISGRYVSPFSSLPVYSTGAKERLGYRLRLILIQRRPGLF